MDPARAGRAGRRRRTAAVVALGALAVVGAGVVLVLLPGSDSPGSTSPDPASADSMPAPPPGMRWVGYADQVVAVPSSWTTGDAPCEVPQSDTVYLASLGEFFCVTPPAVPGVSYVRISPVVNGPAFTVDSPDPALEEQIQDSQREVPAGWTTVPWHPHGSTTNMLRELRREGLAAEIVREYVPEDEGGANRTVPAPGSPVREGTTITVVVPVHRPMVITQAIAAPGEEFDALFPERTLRGLDYVMTLQSRSTLAHAFQLGPVPAGSDGTPSWRHIEDRLPVADIAVGGVGPDRLVVPESAAPGTYRICIENAVVPLCDALTVLDEGAPR